MKEILTNIDFLISDALQKTNESVSWREVVVMVAGCADRVQPVSANTIAKYVMVLWNQNKHQQNFSQQSTRQKQATMLLVVQEFSHLLGGCEALCTKDRDASSPFR